MQVKDGVDKDVKVQFIQSDIVSIESNIVSIYDSTFLLVMLFVHNIVSQYLSTVNFARINPACFRNVCSPLSVFSYA